MKNNSTSPRRATQLIVGAALLLIATVAQAAEPSNLFVRIDNDALTGTDRDYTSGVQVGSTSATVNRSVPTCSGLSYRSSSSIASGSKAGSAFSAAN